MVSQAILNSWKKFIKKNVLKFREREREVKGQINERSDEMASVRFTQKVVRK